MTKSRWSIQACAVALLFAGAAFATSAQTFNQLYNFADGNGDSPYGVVQGPNGDLYGTTGYGGTNESCGNGCGTVYDITLGGVATTLQNLHGADGSAPLAALIQGTDGNLYGTTFAGGGGYSCSYFQVIGCGTVFRITPDGALTTLHKFSGTDGVYPQTALVEGVDGKFYGTAPYGGTQHGCLDFGCGTVFSITSRGEFTTLYTFCTQANCPDGAVPFAALVQGTDGNLYGTTEEGGGSLGCGTIFKITPDGQLTTLHSFDSYDGCEPEGGLVLGTGGIFYGTTYIGGAYSRGTIFKVTSGGTLTTLYSFCAQNGNYCPDGSNPSATLTRGTDGNLYGSTFTGGGHTDCIEYYEEGCGTLFVITPNGVLTTLHVFQYSEGSGPDAALIQDTSGVFYGTTWQTYGGAFIGGTIFSLDVGLAPFVTINPGAGRVGASVGILGTNLTGASSVSFNGIATAFRVVSKTFIEAKVPSGATSGRIQVVTPNATLSSNVPFIVLR